MRNIKKLLDLILLTSIALTVSFLFNEVYAATCTSISRTNASALSVLTSTKYNTDLNTAYTALNAFDAGCITPGTLESDSLNTTQFAPLLKGLKEGCKVEYTNASTLSISECLASVNGNFVTTTTNTSVSFGCTGCSAEVATTDYYVYIQTGSSGTTLTPLILTTAPNGDGYDNTGNKVLARFWNNSASDIDQYSIDQWLSNGFRPRFFSGATYTPSNAQGFGTLGNTYLEFSRSGNRLRVKGSFTAGTTTAAEAQISLPVGLSIDFTGISGTDSAVGTYFTNQNTTASGGVILAANNESFVTFSSPGVFSNATQVATTAVVGSNIVNSGDVVLVDFEVPVAEWKAE